MKKPPDKPLQHTDTNRLVCQRKAQQRTSPALVRLKCVGYPVCLTGFEFYFESMDEVITTFYFYQVRKKAGMRHRSQSLWDEKYTKNTTWKLERTCLKFKYYSRRVWEALEIKTSSKMLVILVSALGVPTVFRTLCI